MIEHFVEARCGLFNSDKMCVVEPYCSTMKYLHENFKRISVNCQNNYLEVIYDIGGTTITARLEHDPSNIPPSTCAIRLKASGSEEKRILDLIKLCQDEFELRAKLTNVQECYDKFGEEYDYDSHSSIRYNESLETPVILDFLKEDNPSQSASFLDVGCGTGRWLQNLYNMGFKTLTGIDISKEMVKAAKKRFENTEFHPNVIYGDAEQLSSYVPEDRFDYVIASFCDHVTNHRRMFTEIRKVLRFNGTLYTSFPDKYLATVLRPFVLGTCMYKTRFRLTDGSINIIPSITYSPQEISELLTSIDFNVISTKQIKAGDQFNVQPTRHILDVTKLLKMPTEDVPVVMVVKAKKSGD